MYVANRKGELVAGYWCLNSIQISVQNFHPEFPSRILSKNWIENRSGSRIFKTSAFSRTLRCSPNCFKWRSGHEYSPVLAALYSGQFFKTSMTGLQWFGGLAKKETYNWFACFSCRALDCGVVEAICWTCSRHLAKTTRSIYKFYFMKTIFADWKFGKFAFCGVQLRQKRLMFAVERLKLHGFTREAFGAFRTFRSCRD